MTVSNGLRPTPGALKGKVKQLCARFGAAATASTLGLGVSVIHNISKGHPLNPETTNRVWLALEEFERRSRAAMRQHPVQRNVDQASLLFSTSREESALPSRLEATERFKEEIWDNRKVIDPTDVLDIESIAVGYFMAKGFSAEDARNLAVLVADKDFYS